MLCHMLRGHSLVYEALLIISPSVSFVCSSSTNTMSSPDYQRYDAQESSEAYRKKERMRRVRDRATVRMGTFQPYVTEDKGEEGSNFPVLDSHT